MHAKLARGGAGAGLPPCLRRAAAQASSSLATSAATSGSAGSTRAPVLMLLPRGAGGRQAVLRSVSVATLHNDFAAAWRRWRLGRTAATDRLYASLYPFADLALIAAASVAAGGPAAPGCPGRAADTGPASMSPSNLLGYVPLGFLLALSALRTGSRGHAVALATLGGTPAVLERWSRCRPICRCACRPTWTLRSMSPGRLAGRHGGLCAGGAGRHRSLEPFSGALVRARCARRRWCCWHCGRWPCCSRRRCRWAWAR